ncbi:GNAT family N-acetyltransferase [Pendulispora albinea]|uniref:GNAT family N-acetyltransferase n=1 Tax=Pendulispora albinea TaxID=2741071 RepID=A0ABZ2LMK2_9BACT
MHCRLVTSLAELDAMREDWEALLARSDSNEPTLSPLWLLAWWRIYGGEGNRALRVFAFYEGKRLVGLVPLLQRDTLYRRVLPFRRLEPLASGEDEADETCSDYLGPIAERGREEAVAQEFVVALAKGAAGPWDEILLPSMSADSPFTPLLARKLNAIGAKVYVQTSASCPFVPLPPTWDEYLLALSSKHRYTVRRALRDFEKEMGAPPVLDVVSRREDLEPTFDTLVELHAERWKEGHGGVFASARFSAFHRTIAPALFERGALDLGLLRADGRPIGAFYNFVWNGKSYFYQSGRALDVPRGVAIGIVMHALLIRRAIERGLREYDFLAGASRYKLDLSPAVRHLVTIRAAQPRLVEHARRTTESAIRHVRTLRHALRTEESI